MTAPTRYALCTIQTESGAKPAIAVGGKHWFLTKIAPQIDLGAGLMSLFGDWQKSEKALSSVADEIAAGKHGDGFDVADDKFLPPLMYPGKVVCAGTNYIDHIHAVGRTSFSKEENIPAMFMKPPTTALVGGGKTAKIPAACTMYDWEIELGVVMGQRISVGTPVSRELNEVAGYMLTLDMSARDFQRNPKHFAKSDLFMGKAFDASCPAGPYFVPAKFIKDPQDLDMKLWRNGKIEQDSNTKNMIWSVYELLQTLTENVTMEPGDLFLTGTPAGTGIESGVYADRGDKIEAEIAGLGRLKVEIY
ncbi:MAG: 4-hydroxyphenylacetate degradation protein [Sneathiella sp.]|jgi:2-keto-4-pentenoate hydratase/2-oxohepta-3-ene-1,7-dioic acid hydratase in catechol pathway|uniref:fumarylacetoacetate hydrolase family protein n=1 Tax=Sneathiella sp. TaxID=1964365 RepID=UPI000C4F829A|nr:fumarylacetoacetate hydrolase family protein [Sneathiella sp.]MAL77893.1 4-hydroxyphenylacetate degradation protein [Sneathiella sp.]|tara:strand:- start:352 stop:1266 length:915 start_codon:yes stop_codon:yes gene_type:complete